MERLLQRIEAEREGGTEPATDVAVRATPGNVDDGPGPDEQGNYSVEKVLSVKLDEETGAPIWLVKWEGYDESHNTWEPDGNMVTARRACRAHLRNLQYMFMLGAN